MDIEEIAQKDIKVYLASLGIDPYRETGRSYVYLSPFRAETIPSFFLWKKNNKWKDFGLNKWGDIIDLVQELHSVSIQGALRILDRGVILDFPHFEKPLIPPKKGIDIMSVNELSSPELISYLEKRGIPLRLAQLHLKQIEFRFPDGKNPGRMHTGAGFRNDSKGWELRNSFFKVSNSPKNITTIHGDKKRNILFEGFIDYLSALVYFNKDKFDATVIVLNSLGYLTTLIPLLGDAERNYLFIDHGKAADDKIIALTEADVPYTDCRHYFEGYQDFNDFLVAKNL